MTKAQITLISSIAEEVYKEQVKKLETEVLMLKKQQTVLELHSQSLENAMSKILMIFNPAILDR